MVVLILRSAPIWRHARTATPILIPCEISCVTLKVITRVLLAFAVSRVHESIDTHPAILVSMRERLRASDRRLWQSCAKMLSVTQICLECSIWGLVFDAKSLRRHQLNGFNASWDIQ